MRLLEFLRKAAICIKNGESMQLVGKVFREVCFYHKVVVDVASVEGRLLTFRKKIEQVRLSDLDFTNCLFWAKFTFKDIYADRVYLSRKVSHLVGEVLTMIGPHDD